MTNKYLLELDNDLQRAENRMKITTERTNNNYNNITTNINSNIENIENIKIIQLLTKLIVVLLDMNKFLLLISFTFIRCHFFVS
jgi:ERCC4-type nuclease